MKQSENRKMKKLQWITFLCMAVILLFTICVTITHDLSQMPFASIVNVISGLIVMAGYCVLALTCLMDRSISDKSSRLFYCLLVIGFLGVLTDNFCWIVDGKPSLIWLNHITAVLSFLLIVIIGPVFWAYQNALYPDSRPGCKKMLLVLVVIYTVYILIASMTGFLYTIDANGNYAGNAGYVFAGIYSDIVLLLWMWENLKRKIPARQRIALLVFNMTPLLAGIATVMITDWAIIYVALFFDFMMMYGVVQMEHSIAMAEQKEALAEQEKTLAVQSRIMAEQSRDLMKKQMQIMMSQIQPHFIYNTLGSISSLCIENPKLAADVTDQFARYLRVNMAHVKNNQLIPFEEELEHTRTYLWIEQIRFADYLHVVYNITCTNFLIPPLTLQPLAENAVKHGITPKEEGGTVIIDVHETPDSFVIVVSDDGMGYDTDALSRDGRLHMGIENVNKRLEILCEGKLEIQSNVGVGTIATVTITKGETQ
ncbi:MAG: sensor histidine kinase [Blautia sp.]